MAKVSKIDDSFKLPVWYKPLLLTLVAIPVAAIIYVNGWTGFAYSFVTCGLQQPVIATEWKSVSYSFPGDYDYSPSVNARYYCTLEDATAARYSNTPIK